MGSPDNSTKELETMQDILIYLLLRDSVPQQTVRKIVKVELRRVTRIGKLLGSARQSAH